jgi:hypothetical protein
MLFEILLRVSGVNCEYGWEKATKLQEYQQMYRDREDLLELRFVANMDESRDGGRS